MSVYLDQALAPQSPYVQTLADIPGGRLGTRVTLKLMRKLVNEHRTHPVIRQLALKLVEGLPQKDYRGEVARLHQFVRDRVRYVRDVVGVETLQTPVKTLELGQGDCDDKSTLLAALLEAVGHRTRFKAVGFKPGQLSHVFPEVSLGTRWIPLETTEFWPPGRKPPGVVSVMVQE